MGFEFALQATTWLMGLMFVGVIIGLENCKPGSH